MFCILLFSFFIVESRLNTEDIRHLDGGVWYEENNLFWVSFRDSLASQDSGNLVRDPVTGVQQLGSRLQRKVELLTQTVRCVEMETGSVCSPSPGWGVPDVNTINELECPQEVLQLLTLLCNPTCQTDIDAPIRVGMFTSPSWILDDFASQRPLTMQNLIWRDQDLGSLSGDVSYNAGWRLRDNQLYFSLQYAGSEQINLDGEDTYICDIRLAYSVLESFDATQIHVLAHQTSVGLEKQDYGQISLSDFSVLGETCESSNQCMDTTFCCSGICGYDTCISSEDASGTSNGGSSGDITFLIIVCVVGFFMIITIIWFFFLRQKRSKQVQSSKKIDMEIASTIGPASTYAAGSYISEGATELSKPTYVPRSSPQRRSRSSERRPHRSRSGSRERDLDARRYRKNFDLMDDHRNVDRISPEDSISNVNGPTFNHKRQMPYRKHRYEPSEQPTVSTIYPHDSVSNIHVIKNNPHVASEKKHRKAAIKNPAISANACTTTPVTTQMKQRVVPQVVPQFAAPPARAATIPFAQPPPPQHTQPHPVVVHLHQSPPQIIQQPAQQPVVHQPIIQQVRQPAQILVEEIPSSQWASASELVRPAPFTTVSHPTIIQQPPPPYSSLPQTTVIQTTPNIAHTQIKQQVHYIQPTTQAYTYV